MVKTAVILLVIFCVKLRAELDVADKKVLVLLDSQNLKETHSKYFKSLSDNGFALDFKQADAASLSLFRYGERLYNHIIIFAPSVEEFGGQIRVESLANFVDDGGNLIVAAGQNLGEAVRDLTAEFGFELDEDTSQVVDHFRYDADLDDGTHSTLVADPALLLKAPVIVGSSNKSPVLFKGVALLPDKENPLVLELLRAPSTAYSSHPTRPISLFPSGIGRNIALIGALQARNNARVVVSGSLDFFSNKFFDASINAAVVDGSDKAPTSAGKSGNQELALAATLWAFKESGVLKVGSVHHHRSGEKGSPADYTIKDDVVYEIEILAKKGNKWVPFDGSDVYLEFVRIDPFVRTKLQKKGGLFVANFMVPDVYGVYQFKVDYDRLGYTHLYSATQVSVRPYKHTEYERFIGSAYPYYLSALSMIVGVFVFVLSFNSFKEEVLETPAKSKKE